MKSITAMYKTKNILTIEQLNLIQGGGPCKEPIAIELLSPSELPNLDNIKINNIKIIDLNATSDVQEVEVTEHKKHLLLLAMLAGYLESPDEFQTLYIARNESGEIEFVDQLFAQLKGCIY